MDPLAVVSGRCPVDRRAYERMAKLHSCAEFEQPGGFRGADRSRRDPESVARAPEQGDIANRLGSGREQQPLRVRRKRVEPAKEAPFDAPRQRPGVWQAESAGELTPRQAARQFQQRERVAARLRDDPVTDTLVQAPADTGAQQPSCVAVCESFDGHLGQAIEVRFVVGLADGEHHGDPFRQQTSRDEGERLGGSSIQPLRIVDQAHERDAPPPRRRAGSRPRAPRGSDPGQPPSSSPNASRNAPRCGPGSPPSPSSIGPQS